MTCRYCGGLVIWYRLGTLWPYTKCEGCNATWSEIPEDEEEVWSPIMDPDRKYDNREEY